MLLIPESHGCPFDSDSDSDPESYDVHISTLKTDQIFAIGLRRGGSKRSEFTVVAAVVAEALDGHPHGCGMSSVRPKF
jgi:hypothetical protein